MIWNALLLALREIKRNLLRSILTMLGIVIGVSAVITMVTLGNGATASVSQQIANLGSNLIMVTPGQRMGMGSRTTAPAFKLEDSVAIAAQIPGVLAVAPIASSPTTAIYGSRNWKTSVRGTDNNYFITNNWSFASGRQFSETEQQSGKAVCIIGDRVKTELFVTEDPLGAELRLQNFSCSVIGVLKAKGQASIGSDQDDTIVAPLRMVQRRINGNNDVNSIAVSAKDASISERLKARVETLLRERRNLGDDQENNFSILDTKQIADTLSGTTKIMTMLLGAVAAVSLIVGGIGIMNIMLVSVTERTREIGIRLAIGAMEKEVLMQFLIEAVALSAIGGIIGIIIATIASVSLCFAMNIPFIFDPKINILAFLFSAFIGILFGYTPAKRAAKLNPIDALRHE